MNLSDFLKGELERMASVPTNVETFAAVEADREPERFRRSLPARSSPPSEKTGESH